MNVTKSKYYKIVHSLRSIPLILYVWGNLYRSDFLYLDTKTGCALLYLWDDTRKESRLLTPGDEPVGPVADLHPYESRVVYSRQKNGGRFSMYVVDYSTNDNKEITTGPGYINKIFWAADDTLLFLGHDSQKYSASILFLDGCIKDLFSTKRRIGSAAYDYQRGLLVAEIGQNPGTALAIIDGSTGKIIQQISETHESRDAYPQIFPEKGYIAYSTDAPKTHLEVVVRSIETLQEVSRVPIPGDIEFSTGNANICWADENTIFVGAARDAHIAPQLVDIRDGKWSDPLSDSSVTYSTCTRDGPIWVSSSISEPPSIEGLRNGAVMTLVQHRCTVQSIPAESHWYRSFDGRAIQGWLLRNPSPDAPLVVWCHSGPTYATANVWGMNYLQELALSGYHVFAPNYRGSTTFGIEFQNLSVGDPGGGDVQDILYGARYVADLLGLTQNPGIIGYGYGGFLVLRALMTQQEEWAGGTAFNPLTDTSESYYLGDIRQKNFCIHFFGGTPEEKPDLYAERSPMAHLDQLRKPVLLLCPENAYPHLIEPAKKFYEKAQEQNLPVNLVVIEATPYRSPVMSNIIRGILLQLEFLETCFK